jgi:hypothetical protein
MADKQFTPGIGRKGRVFIVMGGVVLQPEETMLWQELVVCDDKPSAMREFDQIILDRAGIRHQVGTAEKARIVREYVGPLMMIERSEMVVHSAGVVSETEDA